MKPIDIALITGDAEYGKALAGSLISAGGNFDISLFETEAEAEVDRYDLFITEDSRSEKEDRIILSDDISMRRCDPEKREFVFYKYGSALDMARDIMIAYGAFTGKKMISAQLDGVSVIGFFAYQGGIGCTSLAFGVAQELKRFCGKKVIYISLEELESTGLYMRAGSRGKGIREYLYYLSKGKKKFCRIDAYTLADDHGVEAFAPGHGRNPLLQLSKEDFLVFIDSVINSGIYEYIIFDAGNSMNEIASCAMDITDIMCIAAEETLIGDKREKYLSVLDFLQADDQGKKRCFVINRHREKTQEEDGSTNKEENKSSEDTSDQDRDMTVIEYDESSFSVNGEINMISLDKAFGTGIRDLTSKLTQN